MSKTPMVSDPLLHIRIFADSLREGLLDYTDVGVLDKAIELAESQIERHYVPMHTYITTIDLKAEIERLLAAMNGFEPDCYHCEHFQRRGGKDG